MREILTDAIRYRERGRILYNAVLSLIVVSIFSINWPASRDRLTIDLAQVLIVLAVLANAAYCAAYMVDVTVQLSAFHSAWRRHRWALFVFGVPSRAC